MKLALVISLACSVWAESRCVVVDHSSVTAGDLAAAIPAFGVISVNRHLVWAPAPGLTRWLKPDELQKLAASAGETVSTAAAICVQRKSVVFTEAQVVAALEERLPVGSEVRVLDYCRLPMMSGQIRFETRPSVRPSGEKQRLHWKGSVVGDDRRTAPFWATVQVRVKRRAVRATRQIPVNAILCRDDLLEATEDASTVEAGPSPSLSELVGKETTRKIEPQQLIKSSWLRVPQLIRRGQTVRVMVESGQAKLGLDARALSGGNRGDTLMVKNDENGRTLRAEVTGPGEAAIRLGSYGK